MIHFLHNRRPRRQYRGKRHGDEDHGAESLAPESAQYEENNEGEQQQPEYDHQMSSAPGQPLIIGRNQHSISRGVIDSDALKVMYRLLRHGYKAYLVGGGVRDLLLNRTPKDFDVGTDATPERVRALFRNSRIIGRRFRINHVYFPGNKIIEVATFRASGEPEPEGEATGERKPVTSDNIYGDPASDALRRDLTINGLFYDISNFSVIDYVGGVGDLNQRIIRIIGDPETRIREDPVRMIRAIRHAARIGFVIEPATLEAICKLAELIQLSPRARVYEEFTRELRGGHARLSFELMIQTGLLTYLLPSLAEAITRDPEGVTRRLNKVLSELDEMLANGVDVPLAASFAALLVGNVTRFDLHDGEAPQADSVPPPPVAQFWASSPMPSADLYSLPKLPSRSSRSGRKAEVPPLRAAIDELFLNTGLPRKERELMECLLVSRYLMLALEPNVELASELTNRAYFDQSLLFLRLTAHDETAYHRLVDWEAIHSDENTLTHRDAKRKRRRRRRRGRRRGGQ